MSIGGTIFGVNTVIGSNVSISGGSFSPIDLEDNLFAWFNGDQGITLSEASISDDLTTWFNVRFTITDDGSYYVLTESTDASDTDHNVRGDALNTTTTDAVTFTAEARLPDVGDGRTGFRLQGALTSPSWVTVSLSDGSVIDSGGLVDSSDATVTDLGGGWYRVSVEFPADPDSADNNAWRIYASDGSDAIYTGDGREAFYVRNVTLTQTHSNPRVASWESRADGSAASVDADLTTWIETEASAAAEENYYVFTENSANSVHILKETASNISTAYSVIYTVEFKAVAGGRNIGIYYLGTSTEGVILDPDDGSQLWLENLTTDDYSVYDIGDGWYRVEIEFTADANFGATNRWRIYSSSGTNLSYAGDGRDCFLVRNVSLKQKLYLLQSTFDSQPILLSADQNGHDGLRFDGLDDVLQAESTSQAAWKFLHDGTGGEVWIAWKPQNAASGGFTGVFGTANSSFGTRGMVLLMNTIGSLIPRVNNGSGSQHVASGIGVVSDDSICITGFGYEDGRSPNEATCSNYITGLIEADVDGLLTPNLGSPAAALAIGQMATTNSGEVDIYEIVIISRTLTSGERTLMREYFKTKYGVA